MNHTISAYPSNGQYSWKCSCGASTFRLFSDSTDAAQAGQVHADLAALQAENKRLREALQVAHHELTTLHGLRAFDTTRPYHEALRDGDDHDAAWDVFLDETWKVDVSKTLTQIDAALAAVPVTGAKE